MTLSLKVGAFDGPREHRDDCRDAQVEITGMVFWIVDPPDRNEDFASSGEVWIGDGVETPSIPQFTKHIADLLNAVPKDVFVHSLFVHDWNSYIHLAARDCSIKWLGDAHAYRGRRRTFHPGETIDFS
jgi:hypothetical protein